MTTSLNDIKLVVCDIDGTLTRTGTITPSEYTLDIIKKLHDRGIAFGLGSGRDAGQLRHLYEEWGLPFEFDVCIGLNGSEYFDLERNEVRKLFTLPKKDVEEIVTKMLDRFPELNVSIYRNGYRLLRFEDEMAVMSKKRNKMSNQIVEDISDMWAEDCPKVMFRVSEEVMRQIEPYAISICNENFRCCKTQTTMLEFVNRRSDKGNALLAYCDDHDIELHNVVAFGDMSNDNEMLLMAGTGVCLKNGSADCKACADYITEYDNDEDGCARFIEQYIL
ncbi:MAG: HAD family phosphatase [Erysipelotrichaceae bacterium]|nr:HAD family phosphatase [Erysipelotrichaceae bacterium]